MADLCFYEDNDDGGGCVVGSLEVNELAKCVVYFKRTPQYKGEYGFDWMRMTIGVASLDHEDYYTISKNLTELKSKYDILTIAGDDYYVPWLTMFPKHKEIIGQDVSLQLHAPIEKWSKNTIGDETIVLESNQLGITPNQFTIADLLNGLDITVICENPLEENTCITAKVDDVIVGKLNVVKNSNYKDYEVDVPLVFNYIDDVNFNNTFIKNEVTKLKFLDGTTAANDKEALIKLEDYLNRHSLNQALIQVKFIYDNNNNPFDWEFKKNTLLAVNKGKNPLDWKDSFEYRLRYRGLVKDVSKMEVDPSKYMDYINFRFEVGNSLSEAKKRCVILYLSSLQADKAGGSSALWPTAEKHCIVFRSNLKHLPTYAHEIGHVLGLEHVFSIDANNNYTSLEQFVKDYDTQYTQRINDLKNLVDMHFKSNKTYYESYPKRKGEDQVIFNKYIDYLNKKISDCKESVKLNNIRFDKGKTENIMDYDLSNLVSFFHWQSSIMQNEIKKYYGRNL